MKNKFPTTPLIVSSLLFIILLFSFFYFYKQLDSNSKISQAQEVEWQTEALRRAELKTLDHSIKAIETEKAQLERHFAKSSDIVPFLDTIEALATASGANPEVTSVDILTEQIGLLVDMKAVGSFEGLYKFLTLLENSPYELEFISMNMQKGAVPGVQGSGDPQSLIWNANFKIKLLSFVP